jgi:hypothetical protein
MSTRPGKTVLIREDAPLSDFSPEQLVEGFRYELLNGSGAQVLYGNEILRRLTARLMPEPVNLAATHGSPAARANEADYNRMVAERDHSEPCPSCGGLSVRYCRTCGQAKDVCEHDGNYERRPVVAAPPRAPSELPHLTDAEVAVICRRLGPTYDVPVGAMKWALAEMAHTDSLPDGTFQHPPRAPSEPARELAAAILREYGRVALPKDHEDYTHEDYLIGLALDVESGAVPSGAGPWTVLHGIYASDYAAGEPAEAQTWVVERDGRLFIAANEAEAISVRDALNRLAAGGAPGEPQP